MPLQKKVTTVVKKLKSQLDQAKERDAPWIKQVAMLTGVLAALSGFLDVRSTMITNDAIYQSNQAILAQTEASDAWNEYQAESIKAHINEITLRSTPNLSQEARDALTTEDKNFRDGQGALKKGAQDKTVERDQHLKDGLTKLSEKDLLGYAGLCAQIGIALASVAALVRWRVPFFVGVFSGTAGVVLAGYAIGSQYGVWH